MYEVVRVVEKSTLVHCYNQQQTPLLVLFFFSFILLQHWATGHDWPGGSSCLCQQKMGYVYREIKKTLRRELNHRNSYLLRQLLTSLQDCVYAVCRPTQLLKILQMLKISYLGFRGHTSTCPHWVRLHK